MHAPALPSDESALLVAIITYRRPETLAPSVRAVLEQADALSRRADVLVVDNDADGSARSVVQSFNSARLKYVVETRPGIPSARNAALDSSRDYRLLVFIDDDELPGPGWLAALVDAWERWGCDGVTGPAIRTLDGSEEAWVRASGFFEPTHRPDGCQVAGAPTSNLLLDLETIRRLGLRFDERFATTGGSDTFFTRQLTRHGGVIRWCERAVTFEPTPPERSSRTWVLARDRRIGNAWCRVHLMIAHDRWKMMTTTIWLATGAVRLCVTGGGRLLSGLLTGDIGRRARGERQLARARGLAMGLLGARIEEYRRA